MVEFNYAKDQTALFIVALLKKHGIKKVVAAPGTTDINLVASLQHDGSFEMYSCIDERSAAYMACGIASETGEPVVIICTEATASRDFLPGLTEAYHRKLPILAITGHHGTHLIGHLTPQTIDRSVSPNDCLRLKVDLPILKDDTDVWQCQLRINQAILELTRHGGGPAHINMPYPIVNHDFSVKELPQVRVIKRYCNSDSLPVLPKGRIAVFVGSHKPWSNELETAVDCFCAQHDAIVFCDTSSKFYGKYAVHAFGIASQPYAYDVFEDIQLVIHLGEECVDQPTMRKMSKAKGTWRVSEDGELRDTFRNLENVFEMSELAFFSHYTDASSNASHDTYLKQCKVHCKALYEKIPDLPLSNVYVASKVIPELPKHSCVHLAASNTVRAWSYFEFPETVRTDSNMGCRGIDGAVSASVGNSLVHTDNICFCILGDLTFFYDMSVLGNRHVGNNYRILVINNNGGNILKWPGKIIGVEAAGQYMAAAGHYGGEGSTFIKQYASAVGFEYLCASSKEEFEQTYKTFVSPEITKPMLFEVKTKDDAEMAAFDAVRHIAVDAKSQLKQQAKKLLGDKGTSLVKGVLGK